MKKYNGTILFLVIVFSLTANNYSQVNGISGSKLCVPHAQTLEKGSFEFEPSLSVFNAGEQFSSDGTINSLSSTNIESDLTFRITLGLLDDFELGTSFAPGMEDIFIGSKLNIIQREKLSIALLAGGSIPAGNQTESEFPEPGTNLYTYSIGSSITNELSDYVSFDSFISYTKINGSVEFNHLLNYGTSFGYYLTETFQAVLELNGFHTFNGKFHSRKLSITPGFTFDFSEKLGFAFGIQKDLAGINELNGLSYFSAFTMSF